MDKILYIVPRSMDFATGVRATPCTQVSDVNVIVKTSFAPCRPWLLNVNSAVYPVIFFYATEDIVTDATEYIVILMTRSQ